MAPGTLDTSNHHEAPRRLGNQRRFRQLAGNVPFEMVDTSLGFSIVMDYLERIRLGVYQ
ncbi:antitoxin Xre/MbcA/ParS toxin-binding domain-containing protein [Pseudomonas sp. NBRC 111118]|uniref:antitoxin Xre/MbcA/ParS toxin-binding domain-containing protein n=1 Tax=Pseudomonas sp. NBRC 111118 TaxID=1661033 RepID=UPI0015A731AF